VIFVSVERLLHEAKCVRSWLVQSAQRLTEAEILAIPRGSRNNILWNIGHVITDQCNMIYARCGLAGPLPAEYIAFFDPGTSPADWNATPIIEDVLRHASMLGERIETDYREGRFSSYRPNTLDDGITLADFESALSHCNLHEAMHLGVVVTLRKLVAPEQTEAS
jgi:hypothetical protein